MTKSDNIFTRYQNGAAQLLERLGNDHPRYAEALTYQQRLMENIALTKQEGDTETRRAERNAILAALNDLALEALEISFNALCGLDDLEIPVEAREQPVLNNTAIIGDGNIAGNENVAVVVKDSGTVNVNVWVSATEMLIAALKKLGLSDTEIVEKLLELLAACSNNPRFSQQERSRALEAKLKIAGRTLAEIRIDKELLAVIGLFLTGSLAKQVIETLHSDRTEPSPLPAPTPQPAHTKPHRKPALRQPFAPELVFIPAGKFTMGTSTREVAALRRQYDWARDYNYFNREQPQHTVYLPDYYIGKYPVTNAQYRAFVQATGHRAPDYWNDGRIPRGQEDHPVKWLRWQDVVDYCAWLTETMQDAGCKVTMWRAGTPASVVVPSAACVFRPPTEAEWEKAARGTDGRRYPWGNEPPPARLCNFDENEKGTTPVGQYSPQGDSAYGCADMAGNVWEWTSTRWGPDWQEPLFTYPYRPDAREDMASKDYRIFRGGGWRSSLGWVRCAARGHAHGGDFGDNAGGVRVCVAASFSHL